MDGECTGNVRSTPTPNEILRTVKVSRSPPFCRRITTPWNTWTRSRVPSTTRTCTLTVSPGRNSGMSERRKGCSTRSVLFMATVRDCTSGGFRPDRDGSGAGSSWTLSAPERSALEQVGAIAARLVEGGVAPPSLDLGVVPRPQDLGHRHAAELRRTRVMRVVEQTVLERVALVGLLATDHAGNQPRHRLDEHERRKLATGQHVVSDGDLLRGKAFHHSFIHTLIPATDEGEVRLAGQLVHEFALEAAPRRAQQDRAAAIVAERLDRREHRLGLHDHAGSAPERFVVHGPVPIGREVADVVQVDLEDALGDRPAEQALPQGALKDAGKDREHVDPHRAGGYSSGAV